MAVKTKPASKSSRCLTCANKAQSRGLCWNCLHQAHATIRSGEKSDDELIEAGLILPSKRGGRKATSAWRQKLAKVSK